MSCKETLKDAFEKLYRESIQQFDNKSKDLFFNKNRLVLAKEKMHAQSKENGSPLLNLTGSNKILKGQSDNKTWKTTIFKRKKPPSPRNKAKTLKHQRENLKNSIDKIYFDHLFGQRKITASSGNHTTTINKRNPSFILTRNMKNIEAQKCRSQNQSVSERKNKFITGSKVTIRKKKAVCNSHPTRESEENSLELYGHQLSFDDSGVFGEDSASPRGYYNVSMTNNMNESPRKRRILKDGGGLYSKKSKSLGIGMTENLKPDKRPGPSEVKTSEYRHPICAKDLNLIPSNDKSKRQTKENSKNTEKSGDEESETSTSRRFTYAKEINKMPTYTKSMAKERRQSFKPLFSGHCGGVWKAIVHEN